MTMFHAEEVAGQKLMGTCHLDLCPLPFKFLTRYPTKNILLSIIGHNCITLHHCVFEKFGKIVYMDILLHLNYHSDTV